MRWLPEFLRKVLRRRLVGPQVVRATPAAGSSDNTDNGVALPVFLNPLALLSLDDPWAKLWTTPLSADGIVQYMCQPGVKSDIDAVASRYREISTEEVRLTVAPRDPRIMNSIVWPLRHAKASYIVGNYVGSIALAGAVAEALAVFLFEIAPAPTDGGALADKARFDGPFDRLYHDRQLEVLYARSITTKAAHDRFHKLKQLRKNHLHPKAQDGADAAGDAVAAFRHAVWLACYTIGQDFEEGALVLRQDVVAYLRRTGIL